MDRTARAWQILEAAELIHSAAVVEAAIERVAAEIAAKLKDQYPLVLSVMGGAVVFTGRILPLLNFPLDFDYIHASRYGAARRGAVARSVDVVEIEREVQQRQDAAGKHYRTAHHR